MANVHPQETELYNQIRTEQIKVDPLIWDLIYRYLGEYVSEIELTAFYFEKIQEPIAIEQARKILEWTNKIREIVFKILHLETVKDSMDLEKLKNIQPQLHKVINELFGHYVGNDVSTIHMIVADSLSPFGQEQPVPIEFTQKIINHTRSIHRFLDKLREATTQTVSLKEGK